MAFHVARSPARDTLFIFWFVPRYPFLESFLIAARIDGEEIMGALTTIFARYARPLDGTERIC